MARARPRALHACMRACLRAPSAGPFDQRADGLWVVPCRACKALRQEGLPIVISTTSYPPFIPVMSEPLDREEVATPPAARLSCRWPSWGCNRPSSRLQQDGTPHHLDRLDVVLAATPISAPARPGSRLLVDDVTVVALPPLRDYRLFEDRSRLVHKLFLGCRSSFLLLPLVRSLRSLKETFVLRRASSGA